MEAAVALADLYTSMPSRDPGKCRDLAEYWWRQAAHRGHTRAMSSLIVMMSKIAEKTPETQWAVTVALVPVWAEYQAATTDREFANRVALNLAKLVPPRWWERAGEPLGKHIELLIDLADKECDDFGLTADSVLLTTRRIPQVAESTRQYDGTSKRRRRTAKAPRGPRDADAPFAEWDRWAASAWHSS